MMKPKTGACLLACGLLVLSSPAAAAAQVVEGPADARAATSARTPEAQRAKKLRTTGAEARAAISGRVTLAAGPRQDVLKGEVAQTVIYFLPKAGTARPAPARFSAATYTKGFDPGLLVIPVGSTVSFPNRDVIIHNVFSATPGSAFDLGTYGPGQERSHRFDRAGLVVVHCNVHRGMRANVLVLETPHATQARQDGSFSLTGLPAGPGTLVIWHPRAPAQSIAVTGPMPAPLRRTLVANRPRIGSQ
jgi:plastocyanin